MTVTTTKTDKELQKSVMAELEWKPSVDSAPIGVSADGGVVTLTGFVKSYAEKLVAEKAAGRVSGVKAIAQDIKVRFPAAAKTADPEIAKRIVDLFAWNSLIPSDKIQVKVQDGWVTLSGQANWHYKSKEAEHAASQINGVSGVSNLISIVSAPRPGDVRTRIEDAFRRQANLDAQAVKVSVAGTKVTLDGCVHAWSERRAAERAAWAAPGVSQVIDRITVY